MSVLGGGKHSDQIVIGYDGGASAKAALTQAIELAEELKGGLTIVFGFAPGGYGGGEVPTQREAVKEHGEEVTREALDAAERAKVKAEVELLNEHPAEALMNVAGRREARMIVVGTHGENPIKGVIMGSTTTRLIQHSSVPVLVVRD